MLERNPRSWRTWVGAAIGAGTLCLAACATVDPRPDQEEARKLIRESTGLAEVFDPDHALLTQDELDAITADGLALDEALRLALLNNRRLQAGFLGIGVARAEFVQAGLLRNPALGVAFLLPSGGGRPKLAIDLVESVVDLWELPTRKAIARAELSQQLFDLSRFAGGLVADTKDAYFESVAAHAVRATNGEGLALASRSLAAVQLRADGGVATATEVELARSLALSAELAWRRAEREDATAKRRLAALLSLDGDLLPIELTDPLPEAQVLEIDREALVARSRDSRLDVRAAAAALERADARLGLERRQRFPTLDLGLAAERGERGASATLLSGPTASVTLPLFDQNQAQVGSAEYHAESLRKEYAALVAEVGQEVRAAVDRAASAARTARFVGEELVPQAERSAALAQTAFELGDTMLLQLIESQRALLMARQDQVAALLEAARSAVDVERASGIPWR